MKEEKMKQQPKSDLGERFDKKWNTDFWSRLYAKDIRGDYFIGYIRPELIDFIRKERSQAIQECISKVEERRDEYKGLGDFETDAVYEIINDIKKEIEELT